MSPEVLERTVLRMVRAGGGQASWHLLATQLPSLDAPPDLVVVLQDLKERGLVTQTPVGGATDRWAITPAGEAHLEGQVAPKGPLAADQLARLVAAVHAGPQATLQALRPFFGDGLRLWAVLRQLLAANPADAQRIAEAGLFLPETERGPFARELLDDPRVEVRVALFRAWTPARQDVPGHPLPTVPDAELDDLLRRGLTDHSLDVREAAAALAFLAIRGAQLVGEIVVNLGAPESRLRWWSILALGGARDPISRELLIDLAKGEEPSEACAAIRALGQRPDGHEVWFRALTDPRPDVRDAAVFALATIVPTLTEEELAVLVVDPREPVQQALQARSIQSSLLSPMSCRRA